MTNSMITSFLDWLVTFSNAYFLPIMSCVFFAALGLRYLVNWTLRRSDWFAAEFEKRAMRHIEKHGKSENLSFFVSSKKLLEKTFYEIFENRDKLMRRRGDGIMSTTDRLFLIKPGAAWMVKDLLRQLKILRAKDNPDFAVLTRTTVENNPCFNRVFGVFPADSVNDVLNTLPSMFVVGGIFGTFLGIMSALPQLAGMDLANIEATKQTMDGFLQHVAYAMGASIMGIVFSVVTTIFNTIFMPEKIYSVTMDRFENAFNLLWNASTNNDVPANMIEFNEHRDPLEVLAEKSIEKEIYKTGGSRTHRSSDEVPPVKAS